MLLRYFYCWCIETKLIQMHQLHSIILLINLFICWCSWIFYVCVIAYLNNGSFISSLMMGIRTTYYSWFSALVGSCRAMLNRRGDVWYQLLIAVPKEKVFNSSSLIMTFYRFFKEQMPSNWIRNSPLPTSLLF